MTLVELNLLYAVAHYADTVAKLREADELTKQGITHAKEIIDKEIRLKTLDPVKGTYGTSVAKEEFNLGQSDSNDSNELP